MVKLGMIFQRKPPQCPRCRSLRVEPQIKGRLATWGWGKDDDLFRWRCPTCEYIWKDYLFDENDNEDA